MKRTLLKTTCLTAALMLAGCMTDTTGGGGGGTATVPVPFPVPVLGSGTVDDPYILPAELPPGSTLGIEDYFAMGGVWKLDPDIVKKSFGGYDLDLVEVVYDADNDTWLLTTHREGWSRVSQLSIPYDPVSGRYWRCGGVSCGDYEYELTLFDSDPAGSQYGTYGFLRYYYAVPDQEADFYFHTGLKTEAADVPVWGTATYEGDFEALYVDRASGDRDRTTGGKIAAKVDFGDYNIDIETTTAGIFASGDTYEFSASGRIAGNEFAGSSTGIYTETATGDIHNFAGSMQGAFYGPEVGELAGAFESESTRFGADIIGGFWAERTSSFGPAVGSMTGSGTLADPYVVPSELPAGTDAALPPYTSTVTWEALKFEINGGVTRNYGAATGGLTAIVFNARSGGVDLQLTGPNAPELDIYPTGGMSSVGFYGKYVSADEWTEMKFASSVPSASYRGYGRFGSLRDVDTAENLDMLTYFHFGLKTALIDIPLGGSGNYQGIYEVTHMDRATGISDRSTGGEILGSVDFTTGDFTLESWYAATFASGDTYEFTATGRVVGNTLDGTGSVTGAYTTAGGVVTADYTGDLEGAFYGPGGVEILGSFATTSATLTDQEFLGGFWAERKSDGAVLGHVSGSGTTTSPYILPAELEIKTDGGIEDYLATGGLWSVGFAAIDRNYGTSTETLDGLLYDGDANRWTIQLADAAGTLQSHTLAYNPASETYIHCGAAGCAEDSIEFDMYDADPAVSQYGTFGFARDRYAATDTNMHAYFHTGLATADMPTAGTAAYAGAFEALYVDTATGDSMRSTGGAISASADFGLGTVDMATTTAGMFGNGDTYEFAVTGAAVAGNAFAGGVYAGSYTDVSAATAHAFDGAASGGFYGPAAAEMAGTFEGTSATLPDADITGGFWAKQ